MSRDRADSGDEQRFHKATPVELTHMVAAPVLEEWEEPGPEGGPEPSSSILIRDLQTKLNDARPAGTGDGAEATSKRSRAAWLASSDEWALQAGPKDIAWRIVNVPVEHVEEGGLEIKRSLLANQVCFLPNCEVFIFSAKRTRQR